MLRRDAECADIGVLANLEETTSLIVVSRIRLGARGRIAADIAIVLKLMTVRVAALEENGCIVDALRNSRSAADAAIVAIVAELEDSAPGGAGRD